MGRIRIRDLSAELVSSTPVDVGWSDLGWAERWDYYQAGTCWSCERPTDARGYCQSEDCERHGDRDAEGPMMNYAYPLGDRIDPEAAARAIEHLPLVVVEWLDEETPSPWGTEYALALTGGGMDLSWEIAEAFVQLGFLPPAHFARLPMMAGMTLDGRTRLVLAATRESVRVMVRRARWDLVELRRVSDWLKAETEGGTA